MLTTDQGYDLNEGRDENSDNSGFTAPIDFAGFFISADLVGSAANILNKRACLLSRFQLPTPYGLRKSSEKGIQYQPKLLIAAFSESTPLLIFSIDNLKNIKYSTGRVQSSTISGIYAPVSGNFLYPIHFGSAENTTPAREIISRVLLHALNSRSLNGFKVIFSKKDNKMNNLISYTFKTTPIRTIIIADAPWFVATDVAKALEYRDAPNAIRYLDDDEKDTLNKSTPGKELSIINESGLYSLILRSRKPEAKAFKKFVTSEVLPSIRKTGSYGTPNQPVTNCHQLDAKAIGGIVKRCAVSAVREAIMDIMTSAEQTNLCGEVKDDDLIRCLWNWYATHHKKTFNAIREITRENDELKCKLATIRKAVR